jgi:Putative Actinobacterial Holin-X, holin superfamily III
MSSTRPAPLEASLTIAELLQKFAGEVSLLVQQEFALARAELSRTLLVARQSAVAFSVCALFALGAFGALTTLFVAALSVALPVWAAALIVTVVYAAVAAVGGVAARKSLENLGRAMPDRTIATIEDDVVAVGAAIRRGR